MEYHLVFAFDNNALEHEVNVYIAIGFEPIGGIAFVINPLKGSEFVFAQAMTRHANQQEKTNASHK